MFEEIYTIIFLIRSAVSKDSRWSSDWKARLHGHAPRFKWLVENSACIQLSDEILSNRLPQQWRFLAMNTATKRYGTWINRPAIRSVSDLRMSHIICNVTYNFTSSSPTLPILLKLVLSINFDGKCRSFANVDFFKIFNNYITFNNYMSG